MVKVYYVEHDTIATLSHLTRSSQAELSRRSTFASRNPRASTRGPRNTRTIAEALHLDMSPHTCEDRKIVEERGKRIVALESIHRKKNCRNRDLPHERCTPRKTNEEMDRESAIGNDRRNERIAISDKSHTQGDGFDTGPSTDDSDSYYVPTNLVRSKKGAHGRAPLGEECLDRLMEQMRKEMDKRLDKESGDDEYLGLAERKSSLFSFVVLQEDVPLNLKIPKITYNGSTDPREHLSHYKETMQLQIVGDAILCRVFPAATWFYRLNTDSIVSHGFLSISHSRIRTRKTINHLTLIEQRPNEILKSFTN
ncbi:hypothetical protein CCACVL1_08278 [Corchorus capsularis]|uniref:Uncharacterized protein n=1 Tax=Corchorus capsularis TaxID=210143 RepID=A0A1R3J1G1_COCAP|nr:hypothetical protein CCACVL1_08278 [Corchorus capsularis]